MANVDEFARLKLILKRLTRMIDDNARNDNDEDNYFLRKRRAQIQQDMMKVLGKGAENGS